MLGKNDQYAIVPREQYLLANKISKELALEQARKKYILALPKVGPKSLQLAEEHDVSLDTLVDLEDVRTTLPGKASFHRMIQLHTEHSIEPNEIQSLYEVREQQGIGEEVTIESMAKALEVLNGNYDSLNELMETAIDEFNRRMSRMGISENYTGKPRYFLGTVFDELVTKIGSFVDGNLRVFSDFSEEEMLEEMDPHDDKVTNYGIEKQELDNKIAATFPF